MFHPSEVRTTPPERFESEVEEKAYQALKDLGIPFRRIKTQTTRTMEDCDHVNAALDMTTVKTLFLCNRQQTAFYLFVTTADKPFRCRDFGAALGVSRVSFASEEKLASMAGTDKGGASVFCLLLDSMKDVRLVIDEDVLKNEYYGCTDGTNSGYMRIRTSDLLEKLLPSMGRSPEIIRV